VNADRSFSFCKIWPRTALDYHGFGSATGFLNLEMVRYTLYTGEPITVGFMRLKPGKAFWGWLYTVIGFCERGLPDGPWARATALAAFQLGKIPGDRIKEQSSSGATLSLSHALLSSVLERPLKGRSNGQTGP